MLVSGRGERRGSMQMPSIPCAVQKRLYAPSSAVFCTRSMRCTVG